MIKATNLWFGYSDEKEKALNGVNFVAEKGEFIAVLGSNGCGKSTLAKHFNAILLPEEGQVMVEDMLTTEDEKLFDIRQKVGMVFQNPDNQIVATIVEEDVAFALEHMGVEPAEMRKRVDEALEMVGMSEFSKHATHQLSGGQKQRIAISGVFAMKPRVIVLDEPTAMLDPKGRASVMKILHELNGNGITVVLITHFMDEAAQADRVIVVNEGEILLDGDPHYVFQNAGLLTSVGLDVPPSTSLMFKLRENGFRVPLAVLTDEECIPVIEDLINNKY
jgi:energy-coupling factor transport system ATP-binding protein